jgi:CHAT domain-containing protein/tetratricopeptide (TPR) repeat protein
MTGGQLADQVRNPAVSAVLREHPGKISGETVLRLCDRCREVMRSDIGAATTLAEAACSAARFASDRAAFAEALRMRGHARHLAGENRQAVAAYSRAVQILDRLGRHLDAGRTRSSALQSLIYLGRYEQALDWAARAREVFQADGDTLRLARLDSNEANILHRQDRYVEALSLYGRAVTVLQRLGDLESTGIALRNSAVCHAALYDFTNALDCYRQAASLYLQKGLTLLAAEIGDNIAQMYHMQGNYIEALENYRAANTEQRQNTYHLAVARLDHSDLLLELNLFTEAAELANNAAGRLAQLGVRYEQGKALLNLAIAVFRMGESKRALRLLRQAKGLFRRERNSVWEATADFHHAAFLLEDQDIDKARARANLAMERLASGPLVSTSILALLLLAKIEFDAGRAPQAWDFFLRAKDRGREANTLPIQFQLAMQEGNLHEASADYASAWAAYQQALEILEKLRGQFGSDGLRLSFLSDKAECYERLAGLALRGLVPKPLEGVLALVEQGKSRSLAEAMLRPAVLGETEGSEIQLLRQQLSWCYRQLDRAESAPASPAINATKLRSQIQNIEQRLGSEWAVRISRPLDSSKAFRLDGLRKTLSSSECLIEYFAAGGDCFAFVVTKTSIHCRQLASVRELQSVCRIFRFQMSRGLWTTMAKRESQVWLDATLEHLRRLYAMLVSPLEQWLTTGHWVIVPHGLLHRLPFHALYDSGRFLSEDRSVSYAPSASVHQLSQNRAPSEAQSVSVFGVPDPKAPQILDEVTQLSKTIPLARIYLAEHATLEHWRNEAPRSRLIHLATHGVFRQDNPLFSSLRFGDGPLALYDLYNIRLQADLVTLSGCATGVQEPSGGDEHMGLARGLLVAGASAAQVSLWEVNDASTARYMAAFYACLQKGTSLAEASREAMRMLRQDFPHPFYWAPFALSGNVKISMPGIFFTEDLHPNEERTA